MDFKEFYPETWTSVTKASRLGNIEYLKICLRDNRPTNGHDNRGWRPLHHSAFIGNVECVKLLLKASDVEIDATTFERETALYLACNSELNPSIKLSIAKVLLEAGANPNIENYNCYKTLLNIVIAQGNLELLQLLVDYNIDVNAIDDYYGSSLNAIAIEGTSEMIDIIFKKRVALPQPRSRTCLFFHRVIEDWQDKGHMLKDLIKKPQCVTYINNQDQEGNTPLYLACKYGWRDGILQLLNIGADPNIRTKEGNLPVNVFFCHVEERDLEDSESTFLFLWKLTNKIEFKKMRNDCYSSTVHSIVRSENKHWRKLFELLEKTLPNITVSEPAIPFYPENLFQFDNEMSPIIGSTITPISLCIGLLDSQNQFDLCTYLLQKEADMKNSLREFPPLVAAVSRKTLWTHPLMWQKVVYQLLIKGADPLVRFGYRICPSFPFEEVLPIPFIFALLREDKTWLDFLLLHAVPASHIFNQRRLSSTLDMTHYLRSKNDEEGMPNSLEQSAMISLLRNACVVIKYLRFVPSELIKKNLKASLRFCIVSNRVCTRDLGELEEFEELWERLTRFFPSLKILVSDVANAISTPKELSHLTALSIRESLYGNGGGKCLNACILDFCKKLNLPSKIYNLLMLNSSLFYERPLF